MNELETIKRWNNKKKCVTFSFDDGVIQDRRLITLLNKYGLKATFNLNSSLFSKATITKLDGKEINHVKVNAEEIKELYKEHEVASHTCTHPNLTLLDNDKIIGEVEEDRKKLSKLIDYNVIGFAYPCGGMNNNDEIATIIKENTGIKYARTITSTHSFDLQTNLYRFNPTIHIREKEELFHLGEQFINLKTNKPQLFYIWGHSYELDSEKFSWDDLEKFFKLISNKDDIYYGTNKDAFNL